MRTSLNKPHRSIKTLKDAELPAFTILTGINGSGKTHFLKAIVEGDVSVDIAPNYKTDVKYFEWATLVPNDAPTVNLSNVYGLRDSCIDHLTGIRNEFGAELLSLAHQYELREIDSPWDLAREIQIHIGQRRY